MAIRTITDLPDISINAPILSASLSASRMEISYLTDPEKSIYASRSVSCGVLSEAIAADILNRNLLTSDSLDLSGHLTVKDGLSADGDFYANVGKTSLAYDAKLNFANADIRSSNFKVIANSSLGLSCSNASVTLVNDSAGHGIVNLSQYAKVGNTSSADDDVVNVRYLKQQLAELSAKIIDDINSGAAQIDVKVDIDFPLLGVIYIDHKIPASNTSWAIAGSDVDLTQHPKLKSYIESSDISNKLRMTNTGGNDTWSYRKSADGNILTLPTSDWFFQSIKTGTADDDSLSCTFRKAGLPSHSHTYSRASEAVKSGPHCFDAGSGIYPGISQQTVNTSAYRFGDSDTVQPNATKMFVYFYVGQKTA